MHHRRSTGSAGARLRPELRLILRCAGGDEDDAADEIRGLLSLALDWRYVLEQAARQSVLPLVHRRLSERHSESTPAEALRTLADERRFNAQGSLRLAEALLDVLSHLTEAGVRALPFKGPTLAQQAYGDLGMRSFADLDLLVRPEDVPAARDALLRRGYQPTFPNSPARHALLVRRGSHESFEAQDGVTCELHWRIAARISDFRLDYERLWAGVGEIRVAGRPVPALDPDDLLLVLALHGAKHAWERLGWICDVAELLRRHPGLDWDRALAEAARMRCSRVLFLPLRLAHDLLRAPLPHSVEQLASGDGAVRSLVDRVRHDLFLPPRSGAGTFRFHLHSRERWRDKIALAAGSLTALNQHDLQLVDFPDGVLPLYYLTRPARLAGKALVHLLGRSRSR